ncbi:hypothetical protein Lac2_21340 [Claveliimonas bilis]|uniref:hypothetical protein n=1 Tax=Claveliimonas TaxID=3076670 RepID=UPI00292D4D3B|nr:hypothetical protein [Claveliimonas bilis]BDZ84000.1 hypothetical protein Lac2_21340 [Claveliimonas bilis]
MKRRVKRLLVSMSLCLLLAAAPLGSAKAAGVDSQVNVSYTAQGQQGIGGDGSEGSSTINAGKRTSPVRTGDASLPIAYLAMVMISAGAILLILLKDKKEEKEEESAF